MKISCNHQRQVEVKTPIPVYSNYIGDSSVDISWVWECTFEDIDIHRYKCTQCGEIGYYSGAAKDYYTKGIENPMLGPNFFTNEDKKVKIYREIKEILKIGQYFDVFLNLKSIKLDGRFTIDELKSIVEILEKHTKENK